jgi:ubiquinone/menaquinone biosynthesis C-methylase UbiE
MAAPARTLDALTSATLKHVRDDWWDEAFTSFLVERLRPRAGNRILDVGCGTGSVEIRLSRLRVPQITLFGIDRLVDRAIVAERTTDGHNLKASFSAADACHLPFPDRTFDSTFCVAVLQHVADVAEALREFARVTRAGGRILAVEPDNAARYWYSSTPAGMDAFAEARRFFAALAETRGEVLDARVGPRLTSLFAESGIEPLEVQPFPVSISRLGKPDRQAWQTRRSSIEQQMGAADDQRVREAGTRYLEALGRYAAETESANAGFVELQSTLLIAVVGQRASDAAQPAAGAARAGGR